MCRDNLSVFGFIQMKITAHQSVQIFGWWAQPRMTLAWEDIKQAKLSWNALRKLGFDPVDLKEIQPDKHEWIKRGGVTLTDLKDMTVFPVNPLKDFRVDLAELWNMKCSCEDFLSMNMTFQDLLDAGLNPSIMVYFNMRLSEWVSIGMSIRHVQQMSDQESLSIFGLDKQEVLSITRTFSRAIESDSNGHPVAIHNMSIED